jgi:hypothetical protein
MEANPTLLTAEEVQTLRAAIRAGRWLAALGLLILVPLAFEVVAPALGVALLIVILLSPVLVTAVLVLAARQTAREGRRGAA